VKLTLSHPHRSHGELLDHGHHRFGSYVEAYDHCHINHNHADDYYGDVDEPVAQPDADEYEPGPEVENPGLEDWQELAAALPNALPLQEDIDLLTRRDIDLNYNWQRHVGRYYHDAFASGRYWEEMRGGGQVAVAETDYVPWSVRDRPTCPERLRSKSFGRILSPYR